MSSSYEKEIIRREKEESVKCTNKGSNAIGEKERDRKECGVKDVNSNEGAFSEAEKDTKIVHCPNMPGNQIFLYLNYYR